MSRASRLPLARELPALGQHPAEGAGGHGERVGDVGGHGGESEGHERREGDERAAAREGVHGAGGDRRERGEREVDGRQPGGIHSRPGR